MGDPRRIRLLVATLAAMLLLAACSSGDGLPTGEAAEKSRSAQSESDLRPVDKAIEIANRVEADPDRAVEILAEYDMTEEDLDQLLYEIAADPELRKRYNDATRR